MKRGLFGRLLREPLLHFMAIGALLFAVYGGMNDSAQITETNVIVIGPERITQIKTGYKSVWKKTPTAEELEKLIENDIREEVYYRDALALGLDKGDTVVRKRLHQKLEFLSDTSASFQTPSEEELNAYYQANRMDYQRDPRLAFEQIFLGEKPSAETISQALNLLLEDPLTASLELGVRSLLPTQLRLSRPGTINATFGPGFFEQLIELAPGIWSGPVTSAYGIHLVRTLDGQPAQIPPMKDIRDTVLKDWHASQRSKAREQDYARRRAAYEIRIQQGD